MTTRLRNQASTWINTSKNRGDGPVGAALCVQAGLVQQMAAGLYTLLPLGQRVLDNIEAIISEEIEAVGAAKMSLPTLQPAGMWKDSGRWDVYGQEMLRLVNRQEQEFCMNPTSEEAMTWAAANLIRSAKQLPMLTYQMGRKYRDELRPRGGLLRTREFSMFDAYSFDTDREQGQLTYQSMRDAYERIMVRLGLDYVFVEADAGEIGGDFSEMLLCPAPSGDDAYVIENGVAREATEKDENPIAAIEIGHLFMLSDRYTKPLGADYTNENGEKVNLYGGCFGIGLTRLLPTIIEQNHDDKGINWPKEVAPFDAIIVPIGDDTDSAVLAVELQLKNDGKRVLVDNRKAGPGAKFADAKLMGVANTVVVSARNLKENIIEVESRAGESRRIKLLDFNANALFTS